MKPKLKVIQLKSGASRPKQQRAVLHGLGLRRPRHEVVVANTPAFRGMIQQVLHLVSVEECDG